MLQLIKVDVVFTKHSERKFKDLAALEVRVSRSKVLKIVGKPVHKDRETDYPNIISSGYLDKTHVLRVVYKIERDKILIITFYPAKKGRYY